MERIDSHTLHADQQEHPVYIFPQGARKDGKPPKPSKLIGLIYRKLKQQGKVQ